MQKATVAESADDNVERAKRGHQRRFVGVKRVRGGKWTASLTVGGAREHLAALLGAKKEG
jgi:hypothetical protein